MKKSKELLALFLQLIAFQIILTHGQYVSSECKHINKTIATSKLIADFVVSRNVEQIIINNLVYDDEECIQAKYIQYHLLTFLNTIPMAASFDKLNPADITISIHKIAIVVVISDISTLQSTLDKISNDTTIFKEEYIWLFVFDNEITINFLNQLCKIGFGLDVDITIARLFPEYLQDSPQPINELLSTHHALPMDLRSFRRYLTEGYKLIHNNMDERIAIRISLFVPRPTNKINYILEQVYKIRVEVPQSCIVNSLGISTWQGFYAIPHKEIEFRRNFYGFDFRVGTLEYTIYQNIEEDMQDEEYAIHLYMNFFLDLFNATKKEFNYELLGEMKDGEYDGLFKAVVTNNVDIAIGQIFMTYERAENMFFTIPVLNTLRSIYLRQPESSSINDIYMSPFSPLLLGMVILMCVFIVLLLKMSYILTEDDDLTWSECAMWCAGILFMQGSCCTPKSVPSLGVVIVGLLFGLIVFNAYSASITSTLSIQFQQINSLSDLLTTDFSAGLIQGSNDDEFLNGTDDKVLQQLKKLTVKNRKNFVKSNKEGLEKCIKSRHAHFGSQTEMRRSIFTLPKSERCKISEVQVVTADGKVSFPIPKHSPYRKIIMISLLTMLERGDVSKIRSFLLPDMPHCIESSQFSSAKLSDVFTAFGLLFIIMLISFGMMISEVIWKKCIRRNKKLEQ